MELCRGARCPKQGEAFALGCFLDSVRIATDVGLNSNVLQAEVSDDPQGRLCNRSDADLLSLFRLENDVESGGAWASGWFQQSRLEALTRECFDDLAACPVPSGFLDFNGLNARFQLKLQRALSFEWLG